jgi:hypothetical protein
VTSGGNDDRLRLSSRDGRATGLLPWGRPRGGAVIGSIDRSRPHPLAGEIWARWGGAIRPVVL